MKEYTYFKKKGAFDNQKILKYTGLASLFIWLSSGVQWITLICSDIFPPG